MLFIEVYFGVKPIKPLRVQKDSIWQGKLAGERDLRGRTSVPPACLFLWEEGKKKGGHSPQSFQFI